MALSLLGLAATAVLASGMLLSLSNRAAPAPGPSQAADTQGQFQLTFEMPKTNWRSGEVITGEASLSYLGAGSIEIGNSGMGPIGFEFDEVGGTRHMGEVWTLDLQMHQLERGSPITSPLNKKFGGGWSRDDPNAAFYDSWLNDRQLQLPAGDWTISAIGNFATGNFTALDQHSLRAPILIHVSG